MAPFPIIQSYWADQYGSIDTWNIKIGPLLITLLQNILGQLRLSWTPASLPYLMKFVIIWTVAALYCTAVELEKIRRTDREQRTENFIRGPQLSLLIVRVSRPIFKNAPIKTSLKIILHKLLLRLSIQLRNKIKPEKLLQKKSYLVLKIF